MANSDDLPTSRESIREAMKNISEQMDRHSRDIQSSTRHLDEAREDLHLVSRKLEQTAIDYAQTVSVYSLLDHRVKTLTAEQDRLRTSWYDLQDRLEKLADNS